MDDRERRIGKNEAVFREVNEQIESLNRGMAKISDQMMHIVCECGDLTCTERISVPVTKYEEVRADAALFLIRPGHEKAEVETDVEQGPGYTVVRKVAGEAEQIAEETDPRSA